MVFRYLLRSCDAFFSLQRANSHTLQKSPPYSRPHESRPFSVQSTTAFTQQVQVNAFENMGTKQHIIKSQAHTPTAPSSISGNLVQRISHILLPPPNAIYAYQIRLINIPKPSLVGICDLTCSDLLYKSAESVTALTHVRMLVLKKTQHI